MYYQNGRFSFYLGKNVIWFRLRSKKMESNNFLFRIGKEDNFC